MEDYLTLNVRFVILGPQLKKSYNLFLLIITYLLSNFHHDFFSLTHKFRSVFKFPNISSFKNIFEILISDLIHATREHDLSEAD